MHVHEISIALLLATTLGCNTQPTQTSEQPTPAAPTPVSTPAPPTVAKATPSSISPAPLPAPISTPPATTPVVTAIQPGLIEIGGKRADEVYAAGIQKITARAFRGAKAIEVHSPWGDIYFDWPSKVKTVAFTIETVKKGQVSIWAPNFTQANKADYRAAIEAVVPLAIAKSTAQREQKSK